MMTPDSGFRAAACAFALVAFLSRMSAAADETGNVYVTGVPFVLNGSAEIPRGMFGVHSTALTPQQFDDWGIESVRLIQYEPGGNPLLPGSGRNLPSNLYNVVECLWDRYQPAVLLQSSDWADRLGRMGAAYGSNTLRHTHHYVLEFWNEPYLNWATRPGLNLDGYWFDKQSNNPALPPRLRSTGEVFDYLAWDEPRMMAFRLDKRRVEYVASRYIHDYRRDGRYRSGNEWLPFKWEEGFEFTYRGLPVRLQMMPWVRDKTQKSFYAGRFNEEVYNRMLAVFAMAAKDANPKLPIAAGWDCNMWTDGWTVWRTLYKPTLDRCMPWIDGLTEHHYGGDSRLVPASYEVAYAYAWNSHGRRIRLYNTEAGGMLDPERPDTPGNFPSGPPLEKARGAMTYTLRDILYTLFFCRDKAVARAAHEAAWNRGDEIAFRLLRPLRGRHIEAVAPQSWLIPVAAMNATQLCVAVYNDHRQARTVQLRVDAPAGTALRSARRLQPVAAGDRMVLQEHNERMPPGTIYKLAATVEGKGASVWVFDVSAEGEPAAPRVVNQYPAADILASLNSASPGIFNVRLPAEELQHATRATLRLFCSAWPQEILECHVNGRPLNLESRGTGFYHEQPVPLNLLGPDNRIRIGVRAPGRSLNISSLSLYLETDPAPATRNPSP